MPNPIESSDKALIVERFSSAVEAGAEKPILDGIRRELEQLFCPNKYSSQQVNAVCSQVIIQRNRKQSNSGNDVQEEAGTNVIEPPNQELPIRNKPPKVKVHPKSGAWTDFERSAIKETWRKAEVDFIDRHIDKDPELRANMHVLCTPGIKCYLEIRHLLSLGFKPSNITAIEADKNAWADFEKNALEIGVKPVYGDLVDLLPKMQTRFDIACIDFLGGGSVKNLSIIESLPLSERAIVAINIMAKREKSEFQEMIGRLHKTASTTDPKVAQMVVREELSKILNTGGFEDLHDAVNKVNAMSTKAYDALEEHLSTDNDMSWDERDTMLWYLQRYAGTGRPESWAIPDLIQGLNITPESFSDPVEAAKMSKERMQRSHCFQSFKELMKIQAQAALTMLTIVDEPKLLLPQQLMDLLNAVCFGRRQIIALEKYRYNSQVGKTASPYFTSLAVTELPRKEYRKFQDVAHFGLKFAEAQSKIKPGDELPLTNDMDYNKSRQGIWSALKLSVVLGKRKLVSINQQRFLDQLHEYFKVFVPQYPLSLWENQKQIPWVDLKSMSTEDKNS